MFTLRLQKKAPLSLSESCCLRDVDCIEEFLSTICEALSASDAVDFCVSGFGRKRWPVDVRTDLPTVLEQIPEAIKQIGLGKKCAIDFYEQGIEATISLSPDNDSVALECASQTSWQPNPSTLSMPKSALQEMLRSFKNDFSEIAASCFPIENHRFFLEWSAPTAPAEKRAPANTDEI